MLKIAPAEERDQSGFSLVELVVVVTLLLLVLGSILGILESLTTSERTTSTRIDDEQAARVTLAQLNRDVRGASAVLPQASLSAYASTLDVLLSDSAVTHIQWLYDPVGQTLTRYVVAADSSKLSTAVLSGVANASFGTRVFTWLNGSTDLASASWATTGDVARCAVTVQATVVVGVHPHVVPQTQTVRDALRNDGHPKGCA